MPRTKLIKRSITLIELMVVITLITIVLGAVAISIPKALKRGKFERSVEAIIAKITLAQELMLDFHTDVTLTFKQQESALACHLETACPLKSHIEKECNRISLLQGIEQVTFNGIICPEITLHFEGSLGISPKGVLAFTCNEHAVKLPLKGYPTGIKRGEYEIQTDQADYPEEILSTL